MKILWHFLNVFSESQLSGAHPITCVQEGTRIDEEDDKNKGESSSPDPIYVGMVGNTESMPLQDQCNTEYHYQVPSRSNTTYSLDTGFSKIKDNDEMKYTKPRHQSDSNTSRNKS